MKKNVTVFTMQLKQGTAPMKIVLVGNLHENTFMNSVLGKHHDKKIRCLS